MKTLIIAAALAVIMLTAHGAAATRSDTVRVLIHTREGDITAELYRLQAPLTTDNFLRYVDSSAFDGSSFYRTVTLHNQPDSPVRIEVIQGGLGPSDRDSLFPPVRMETTAMTGIRHTDGALSMARNEPNTATTEFFICIGDQPELDFGGRRNPDDQGFAAFGRVVSGMEVVRAIQASKAEGQWLRPPISIISIRRISP